MNTENLIPADAFCNSHSVEITFIHTLGEYGLIDITELDNMSYIHAEQLRDIEKYLRLHYELNINMEGIEAITHLLERMSGLESEVVVLRNRLKRYEEL
jgi:hypothetical protein